MIPAIYNENTEDKNLIKNKINISLGFLFMLYIIWNIIMR